VKQQRLGFTGIFEVGWAAFVPNSTGKRRLISEGGGVISQALLLGLCVPLKMKRAVLVSEREPKDWMAPARVSPGP
jgi:hypothetical protein